MDPLAEIKSRVSIEQLVGRYVQLKKAGRSFKGLCPFHKEKTPSFIVSPEKQMAYCFGCRRGGDIFKFVQEMEGVDFRAALKMLAEQAGVKLPERTPEESARAHERASERDRIIEIHEVAAKFFERELWDSSAGKKVLSYLKKRGLKEETIKKARLGFAPDRPSRSEASSQINAPEGRTSDSLYSHLLEKGFSRTEILASGLAIARDTVKQSCVDRFRTRLIFPITNLSGNICAFGGRALESGVEPKYLNSPETQIYYKNEILYGFADAKAAIRNEKKVIIVEGYMDAISVQQAGIANVVACSGTALTENHLRLLKRFTNELIFAFDLDNAGKLATERSIQLALADEFFIRVAVWDTEGKIKDPDECIKSSPEKFAQSINDAAAVNDYLFEYFSSQFDRTTVDGKMKIITSLLPFFARTKSPIELDEWMKKCANSLNLSHRSLYDELKNFQRKQAGLAPSWSPKNRNSAENDLAQKSSPDIRNQEYLLGLVLTYPETFSIANQLVSANDFTENELQNIYRSISSQYNSNPGADDKNALQKGDSESKIHLSSVETERVNILRMYAESRHADMQWDAVEGEVKSAAYSLLKRRVDREKRSLVEKLRSAKGENKESLLQQYQEILSREKNYG